MVDRISRKMLKVLFNGKIEGKNIEQIKKAKRLEK